MYRPTLALLTTLCLALGAVAANADPVIIGKVSVAIGPHLTEKAARLHYGSRELTQLQSELKRRTESALRKAGRLGASGPELDVVIEDADPNHPTFEQGAANPSLDMFKSVSLGGAEITSKLDGVRPFAAYRWYETDIRIAREAGTWTDAEVAFDGFADAVAAKAGQ